MSTSELQVALVLKVPGLPDLDLCSDHTVYRLEAETRNERAVSFRKQEVTSPFVEGTYQISAVRENVMENVGVWVYGLDHAQFTRRLDEVLERLEAPRWTAIWAYPGVTEEWACQSAGYTVRTQREFQHAKMGLVKTQVPRLPRVTKRYDDGTVVIR